MLLSYLHLVSRGENKILLPVGSDQSIGLSARPLQFETPVKLTALDIQDSENDIDDVLIEFDESGIEVDTGVY